MDARIFYAAGVGLLAAACAIHPLPNEATGFSTYAIVAHVRCEARDAIQRKVVALLEHSPVARTREVGADLKAGRRPFLDFDYDLLDAEARKAIEKYDGAAIAYDFTFDIEEKNDFGFGIDLVRTFSRGPATAPFDFTNKRSRQNTRNFRIADTFVGLVELKPEYCERQAKVENIAYPISGRIGLAELVSTFLDLNQSGGLTGDNLVPRLADTLKFQTSVTMGATPGVTLTPVGRALQIAGADLNISAARIDLHQVQVAVSLPPDPKPAAKPRSMRGAQARGQSAARAAINELDRQQNRALMFSLDQIVRDKRLDR